MSYAEKIDELYYAKRNNPSFNEFKNKYHFVDDLDRQYMIAVKERQIFAKGRFRNKRVSGEASRRPLEPVLNNNSLAKLYVKLADPSTQWYTHRDINKPLVLTERGGGRSFEVILKKQEHADKSRTGIVYVTGLDKLTLTEILNQ